MESLSARDSASIWHPFTALPSPIPELPVLRGRKEYLYLEDGRRILDMISSWWVNLHGHSHPFIAKAIHKQARKLEHVIFAGFTHKPAVELAEALLQETNPLFSKVFFSDNGSTAVEVALKMAVQYHFNRSEPRTRILAFRNSYHGDTFGAMSAAERGLFNLPFHKMMFEADYIDYPTEENLSRALKHLQSLLKKHSYAAFIYEPLVQGAGGMNMTRPKLLNPILREIQNAGVILIADEVMTGFYRTGTFLASNQVETKPDLVCLSKGITGGFLPLSVTLVAEKVAQAFRTGKSEHTFYHGHSYTANPIAISAALASYKLLRKKKTLENIRRIKAGFANAASEWKNHPAVKRAEATGCILAVELQSRDGGYLAKERNRIYKEFLSRNILVRPLGSVLYFMPPYCVKQKNLERVFEATEEVLSSFE